jgi:transcriptional regulator with XRE-family HTH domain
MTRDFVRLTLRHIRRSTFKMSQAEFAAAIGLKQSWLSRVETGQGSVPAENYLRAYRLWKSTRPKRGKRRRVALKEGRLE